MAKRSIRVDYDKDEDLLHLFNEKGNVKFSINIGVVVVDFDFRGYVVGIEFSELSKQFPMLKKIDANKIKGDLSVNYGPNWIQIFYTFSGPNLTQINSSIITPYKRKLVVAQ